MNAQQLLDLDFAIFLHLAPKFPRGYTSAFLFDNHVARQVACTADDLEARLHFFKGLGQLQTVEQDENIPDLPPYWALTSAGVTAARKRGINVR